MSYRPADGGARREKCRRCALPVLRQLVGQRAALDVTADASPMPAREAWSLREPNRLDWCLRTTSNGPEMRWADCHRRDSACPHPHVIDHACTAPPQPARPARRSRSSVPDGQLTL